MRARAIQACLPSSIWLLKSAKACLPKVCSGFGIKDTRKQIDKAGRVNTIERDML